MTTSLTSVGAATSSISSMDETNPSASKPITDGDFSQEIQDMLAKCREAFSARNPSSICNEYAKCYQKYFAYLGVPGSNKACLRYLRQELDMPSEIIKVEVMGVLNRNHIAEAIEKLNLIPFLSQQITVGKTISFRVKRLIFDLVKQGKFQEAVELSEKLNTGVFIDIPALQENLSHLQKELVKKLVEKNEINLAYRTMQRMADSDEKGYACCDLVKYYCNINDLDKAESCAQEIPEGIFAKGRGFIEIIKKCCELGNYSRAQRNKNEIQKAFQKKHAETLIQESLEKEALAEVESLVNREEFPQAIMFIQELDEFHSLGTRVKLQLELVRKLVRRNQIELALQVAESINALNHLRLYVVDCRSSAYQEIIKYYLQQGQMEMAEALVDKISKELQCIVFYQIIEEYCKREDIANARRILEKIPKTDQSREQFVEYIKNAEDRLAKN